MSNVDIRAIALAMAVGTVACGFAAGGQTFSLAPLGNKDSEAATQQSAAATDGETVKVQGRGVGVNKDAALKDAYRDAIERAVGLYVDAEVALENDQLVKDQVLTQSNAYITDYRELGEERIGDGLVQLRILATVKKTALTTKLSGVMPPQTVAINTGLQNVHAQLVTKEKRAVDAAALLKNALEGINPMKSLMVASMRPETQKILTGNSTQMNGTRLSPDQVMLRYIFEIKLDRAKYFAEFVPDLKKVLEQISLSPPKEIRLMEMISTAPTPPVPLVNKDAGKYGYLELPYDMYNTWLYEDRRGSQFDPIHVYSISWKGGSWTWNLGGTQYRPKSGGTFSSKEVHLVVGDLNERYVKSCVYFALITRLSDDCANGKVTIYELDKSTIAVLNDWRRELVNIADRNDHAQKTTNYNIVFLDKSGNEIGVYPWQVRNGLLMNVKFAEVSGMGMVYATPFVGCFGENFIQWRDFILEKDQLAKIASAKIELAD